MKELLRDLPADKKKNVLLALQSGKLTIADIRGTTFQKYASQIISCCVPTRMQEDGKEDYYHTGYDGTMTEDEFHTVSKLICAIHDKPVGGVTIDIRTSPIPLANSEDEVLKRDNDVWNVTLDLKA